MAYETTSELAVFVERELGHSVSGASSQRSDIVSQLDRAHKIVLGGGGILNYDEKGQKLREEQLFAFARATNPKIVNTVAFIDSADGSSNVTATQGSNSISFGSDPNGGVSVQGYHIRINGGDEVYRITAHTAAATTATLDAAFVDSNVAAQEFEIFKLQYTVGSDDILRLLSPIRVHSGDRSQDVIDLVEPQEMFERYPLSEVDMSFPSMAAVLNEDDGTYTIQLCSPPENIERMEFDYVAIPTELDTSTVDPIIPARYRICLAHLACYFLMVRNDDNRAPYHIATARQLFGEMVDWNKGILSSGDRDYGRVRGAKQYGGEASMVRVRRPYTIS